MNPTSSPDELEITFWRRALVRHGRLVAAVVVLFVVVTVAAVLLRPPAYSASTEVFVSGADVGPEVQFVQSRYVQEAVAAELGYQPDVTVEADESTWVLAVSASAPTPEEAERVATTYAGAYVRLREQAGSAARRASEAELEQSIAGVRSALDSLSPQAPPQAATRLQEDLSTYQDALTATTSTSIQSGPRPVVLDTVVADAPASSMVWLYAAAAAAIGLVAGAGLAGAVAGLDPHVPSAAYAAHSLRAPLFGTVPPSGPGSGAGRRPGRWWARRRRPRRADGGESIAMIRALVLPGDRDKVRGSVLVCATGSADRSEARAVATGLATSFARTGATATVVRAEFDGTEGSSPGLTTVLAGQATLADALVPVDGTPGLSVLSPGEAPGSTVDLLSGRAFGRLLEELEKTVDVVVLLCDPLGEDPGAALVSRSADATILVVSERSRRDELQRADETLRATGGRTEGIVYIGEIDR
ncbi:putative tyrosine-protein kinase [Pseudonocardia sp. Ae168_Ps1]|uniref:hypothetical protein n=1 Tax=unclassified Pseudonocardia TaxID=2619320 RepID=UPI00094B69DE|nr:MULTISPECIES: hypothetical protein [unclassified Pseudonocardia]OLL73588.1 putative tyrosine-protein kinase [Pseudonocardia sp. Ae150A_Ps1]OLL79559.1 putative tyrosine-protein kinase [Pseudonocardia sp. Ae168_Ps1]OLL86300.1 putative tyrosine-protein kinase [Pseudonocardia sp. Ae263_Ps1]OLL93657.1 putative tyrosine-protein kinase [Pseudonocardia sp. Ae356_Ps1]